MKYAEIMTEAGTGRIRLESGRSILPMPKGKRWKAVGKPIARRITELDLNPDGLATAQARWLYEPDFVHTNSKPVSITYVDGIPHVIDGYHRVVQAARDGTAMIEVQVME